MAERFQQMVERVLQRLFRELRQQAGRKVAQQQLLQLAGRLAAREGSSNRGSRKFAGNRRE